MIRIREVRVIDDEGQQLGVMATADALALAQERGLALKHPDARVLSCRGHLDALGYRIRREGIVALPRALRRLAGRMAAEIARPPGRRSRVDLERSIASSAGVVLF